MKGVGDRFRSDIDQAEMAKVGVGSVPLLGVCQLGDQVTVSSVVLWGPLGGVHTGLMTSEPLLVHVHSSWRWEKALRPALCFPPCFLPAVDTCQLPVSQATSVTDTLISLSREQC